MGCAQRSAVMNMIEQAGLTRFLALDAAVLATVGQTVAVNFGLAARHLPKFRETSNIHIRSVTVGNRRKKNCEITISSHVNEARNCSDSVRLRPLQAAGCRRQQTHSLSTVCRCVQTVTACALDRPVYAFTRFTLYIKGMVYDFLEKLSSFFFRIIRQYFVVRGRSRNK